MDSKHYQPGISKYGTSIWHSMSESARQSFIRYDKQVTREGRQHLNKRKQFNIREKVSATRLSMANRKAQRELAEEKRRKEEIERLKKKTSVIRQKTSLLNAQSRYKKAITRSKPKHKRHSKRTGSLFDFLG